MCESQYLCDVRYLFGFLLSSCVPILSEIKLVNASAVALIIIMWRTLCIVLSVEAGLSLSICTVKKHCHLY